MSAERPPPPPRTWERTHTCVVKRCLAGALIDGLGVEGRRTFLDYIDQSTEMISRITRRASMLFLYFVVRRLEDGLPVGATYYGFCMEAYGVDFFAPHKQFLEDVHVFGRVPDRTGRDRSDRVMFTQGLARQAGRGFGLAVQMRRKVFQHIFDFDVDKTCRPRKLIETHWLDLCDGR
jgi:hypothetical protein